jgi:hypothetical protein
LNPRVESSANATAFCLRFADRRAASSGRWAPQAIALYKGNERRTLRSRRSHDNVCRGTRMNLSVEARSEGRPKALESLQCAGVRFAGAVKCSCATLGARRRM